MLFLWQHLTNNRLIALPARSQFHHLPPNGLPPSHTHSVCLSVGLSVGTSISVFIHFYISIQVLKNAFKFSGGGGGGMMTRWYRGAKSACTTVRVGRPEVVSRLRISLSGCDTCLQGWFFFGHSDFLHPVCVLLVCVNEKHFEHGYGYIGLFKHHYYC